MTVKELKEWLCNFSDHAVVYGGCGYDTIMIYDPENRPLHNLIGRCTFFKLEKELGKLNEERKGDSVE